MTLSEFVTKFKSNIKDIENIYKGLTITELSLPNFKRNTQQVYSNSYYVDANNDNYNIKLLMPINVLEIAKQNGYVINENVSVDIEIDSISLDRKSTILIKISKVIESGISEQELFIKNLIRYCKENKLFDRAKKNLPSLVKKIALISTSNTNTLDDILSKLNYANETFSFKVNNTSESIAKQINLCQNEDYDVILLYRGGHEDKSMNIYSNIAVLDAIHNSSVHVGVALGHEIDIPFVYKLADSTYSTPTNFAQVINEYNANKINLLASIKNNIIHHISKIRKSIFDQLDNYKFDINLGINKLSNSVLINMEKINYHISKTIYDKTNDLNKLSNNMNYSKNKFLHSNEVQIENFVSSINGNTLSVINSMKRNLLDYNKNLNTSIINFQNKNKLQLNTLYSKINNLSDKTIKDNEIISNSTFTSINNSAMLTHSNMQIKLVNLNSRSESLTNILIEKMNNDLLNIHSNIQLNVSNLELNITKKKDKIIKRTLVITLVFVVLIAAFVIIRY